jgi:DNA polymerase IIIc chi subunit
MLAKCCAVCFIVLIASPLTAPFSTVGVADFVSHGPTHGSNPTHTPLASPAVQDDGNNINDAVVSLKRSHMERSRRCSLTVASDEDSAAVHLLRSRFTPLASTARPLTFLPLHTSLRI